MNSINNRLFLPQLRQFPNEDLQTLHGSKSRHHPVTILLQAKPNQISIHWPQLSCFSKQDFQTLHGMKSIQHPATIPYRMKQNQKNTMPNIFKMDITQLFFKIEFPNFVRNQIHTVSSHHTTINQTKSVSNTANHIKYP